MNQNPTPKVAANCSPVFSIAGAMPGASQMAWTTAFPNPDADIAAPRPAGHGVSFSMAGAMPGGSQTAWRTAMPDPTRDMLDDHGYVITIAEGNARAALAAAPRVPALEAYTARTRRAAA